MDKDNVVPRINHLILYTEWQHLNLISTSGKIILPYTFLQRLIELWVFLLIHYYLIWKFSVTADVEDFSTFSFLDSQDKSAIIAENMYYLTQEGNKHILFPEFIPKIVKTCNFSKVFA